MAVAEIFHSAFSVCCRLFVNGPVSCDKQAATVFMERLSCRPCKYVTCLLLSVPSLKNSHVSFLACWSHLNEPWELINFPSRNSFVSQLGHCLRELTSSVQRAALREAWGALSLGDPLSSPLVHYENMWSVVGANHSLENTDK